jgi:hypothetical protein
MPCVARLREMIDAAATDSAEEEVHNIKLWMPSAILMQALSCDVNLVRIEWKLRTAQAHEALHELRQHLRLKRHLTGFKKDWITGQRAHTRSRGVIDTVQNKINTAAAKYRIAWTALESLAVTLLEVDWKIQFPKLEIDDVRGMTEDQAAGESLSEGRRFVAISWIWKQRYGAGQEELSDGKFPLRSLSTVVSLNPGSQLCASSGARLVRVLTDGRRKSSSCKRRCVVFWHSLIGMQPGGRNELRPRPGWGRWRMKVQLRMLSGKLTFVMPCMRTVHQFGVPFLLTWLSYRVRPADRNCICFYFCGFACIVFVTWRGVSNS